jgi:hypothetical protein
MTTEPWQIIINDTKARAIELVTQSKAGQLAPRTIAEILTKLRALPGPNAHVDARGKGEAPGAIFVGEGDKNVIYKHPHTDGIHGPTPELADAGDTLNPPTVRDRPPTEPRTKRTSKKPDDKLDTKDEHVVESVRESDKAAHIRPGL